MSATGRRRPAAAVVAVLLGLAAGCANHPHPAPSPTTPVAMPTLSSKTPTAVPTPSPSGAPTTPASPTLPVGGSVPAGFSPVSESFVSDSVGYLLGAAPCSSPPCTSLLRTTDGGRSFAGVPAPRVGLANEAATPPGQSVVAVRFADPSDGFVYGPELWVTHDGAASWHQVSLPGPVIDLAAAGGTVYAVLGCAGPGSTCQERLYATPAGEDGWLPRAVLPVPAGPPPGSLGLPTQLVPRSAGRLWVIEEVGGTASAPPAWRIYRSADGGSSLTPLADPCQAYLLA
ncbi:MAG: WD40/YVTN/BNR-like repeat-containing protein, partial [Mycobacteriales bacterium]